MPRRRNPMTLEDAMVFFDEVLSRGEGTTPSGVTVEVTNDRPLRVDVGEGDLEPHLSEYLREIGAEVTAYPFRNRDKVAVVQGMQIEDDQYYHQLSEIAQELVEDGLEAPIGDHDLNEWLESLGWPSMNTMLMSASSANDLMYDLFDRQRYDDLTEAISRLLEETQENPRRRGKKRLMR